MTAKDLPQAQRNLYEKAVAAVRLLNNDYAIQLLMAILKDAPDFLEGRQLCRKAAEQKKQASKKFLGLNTGGLNVMKLSQKAKKDPSGTIVDLEVILADDPHSVQANQMLFECAVAAGMPEVAAFALETVRKGHPENTKVMHRLAEYYMESEQPGKAAEVYESIKKVDPSDGEARKGATNASAKLSMTQAKWTGSESGGGVKSLMKDNKEAQMLELASKQGLTKEQNEEVLANFMDMYAQDNTNINTVQKIGEILERLERYDESYQYYHYAWTLSNGDSSLETKVNKLQDKLSEIYIGQLRDWIAQKP